MNSAQKRILEQSSGTRKPDQASRTTSRFQAIRKTRSWSPPEIALPALRPDQWEIARHPAQIQVLAAGRRWGKTVLGAVLAVTAARDDKRVAWIVPNYGNGRPLWRQVERALAPFRKYGLAINRADRIIEFPRGGGITIYSMDNPDSIRGEAFHLVILDEAAMISEDAWTDAIQPTLADYSGKAILISTPKGQNWFHREFLRGLDPESETHKSWHAPSAANPNPRIQRAAELARDLVSDQTYRQEWLAEFIEHEGTVFRNIDACLTALRDANPRDHEGHRIVGGLDWGQLQDATALSIFCADCRVEVFIDRFFRLPWQQQRDRVKASADLWKAELLVELNSIGSPNLEALVNAGLDVQGFMTTAASKPQIIQSLALAFEKAEARWLPDPVARGELEAYEATLSTHTGRPQYSAPSGSHDDTVIARALALRMALVEPLRLI